MKLKVLVSRKLNLSFQAKFKFNLKRICLILGMSGRTNASSKSKDVMPYRGESFSLEKACSDLSGQGRKREKINYLSSEVESLETDPFEKCSENHGPSKVVSQACFPSESSISCKFYSSRIHLVCYSFMYH